MARWGRIPAIHSASGAKRTLLTSLDGIAGARGGFEALAVEDMDLAAAIADELPALQVRRGHRDTAPAYTEHIGEKLMREVEMIGMRAVVRHQQPASQTWRELVKAHARRGSRQLRHQQIQVAAHDIRHLGWATQLAAQIGGGDSQCRSVTLNDCPDRRLVDAENDGRAQHAFAADESYLERLMVIENARPRDESLNWKIGVRDAPVRLAEHLSENQLDVLAALHEIDACPSRQAGNQCVPGVHGASHSLHALRNMTPLCDRSPGVESWSGSQDCDLGLTAFLCVIGYGNFLMSQSPGLPFWFSPMLSNADLDCQSRAIGSPSRRMRLAIASTGFTGRKPSSP